MQSADTSPAVPRSSRLLWSRVDRRARRAPGISPPTPTRRRGRCFSGGAWNASIVAEIVTYGATTLTATGLGAYIAEATGTGDFHRILAGVAVMSSYIVGLNRVLWRRLYRIAAPLGSQKAARRLRARVR
jgi:hypothetical protein